MLRGEYHRLRAWLRTSRIPSTELDDVGAVPAERIRFLNAVESRFDDVLGQELSPPPDWVQIRGELGLLPTPAHPWYDIGVEVEAEFSAAGYTPAQAVRARRLWHDFVVAAADQLSETQAAEGWKAGLEYLICRLYFLLQVRQREIARRHHVSPSTVSMRYRALVEALGVVVFDHPSRKRLDAMRTLAVDSGPLSEHEFRSRLLAGDLSSL